MAPDSTTTRETAAGKRANRASHPNAQQKSNTSDPVANMIERIYESLAQSKMSCPAI
jgi:hypothetical protein